MMPLPPRLPFLDEGHTPSARTAARLCFRELTQPFFSPGGVVVAAAALASQMSSSSARRSGRVSVMRRVISRLPARAWARGSWPPTGLRRIGLPIIGADVGRGGRGWFRSEEEQIEVLGLGKVGEVGEVEGMEATEGESR